MGENPEEYGREIALIKELYKEVGNDFNSHSMTLYSGRITGALGNSFSYRLSDYEYLSECGTCPSVDKIWFIKSLCTPFNPWVPNTNKRCQPPIAEGKYGGRSGCLYTGDYNMSEEKTVDELCEQYSLYWNTLLAMQVPHHGSKLSYNRKLVKEGVIYFISAARKNNFNHPSFQVVNNISLMGGHPIIVTEDFESNVCFETMFPDCFFVKENQNRKETEDNQIGVIIIQTPPSIEYRYGQS